MDVVKGLSDAETKAVYLRVLNIVQCGLTIALLTCSAYLSVQIYRIVHAPLGYEYGNGADISVLRLSKEPATLPHRSKEAALREACFFLMRHTLGRREQQYHLYSFGGQHLGDEFPDLYRDSAFLDIYHIQITEDRHTPIEATISF